VPLDYRLPSDRGGAGIRRTALSGAGLSLLLDVSDVVRARARLYAARHEVDHLRAVRLSSRRIPVHHVKVSRRVPCDVGRAFDIKCHVALVARADDLAGAAWRDDGSVGRHVDHVLGEVSARPIAPLFNEDVRTVRSSARSFSWRHGFRRVGATGQAQQSDQKAHPPNSSHPGSAWQGEQP
jgi:hypothetical protein